MIKTLHPWQQGPSELIAYALEHMHEGEDFNQRIAFLLIDVGVETLLKTFLTLPDEITEVKTPFHKRVEGANGNFHDLIRTTKDAAQDKLKDIDLSHVQFYHDIRNKLYHQGNGITISSDLVNGYAKLSVDLLKTLLEFDLTEVLRKPEIEAEQRAQYEQQKIELATQTQKVQQKVKSLENAVELAIEKINPQWLLPSYVRTLETSDPTQVYIVDLEKEIADIQNLSGYHYLAKLYPQYAQQPDMVSGNNGETTFKIPSHENVIAEGDSLLTTLGQYIEKIEIWVKNAT